MKWFNLENVLINFDNVKYIEKNTIRKENIYTLKYFLNSGETFTEFFSNWEKREQYYDSLYIFLSDD